MKLKNIFIEALEDFDDSPLPGMNNAKVLYLPNTKFVISIFGEEKKILFTPQKHTALPNKIQEFIYQLKEYFNIISVKHESENILEVVFDPRQNFDDVILYIQEEMGVDEDL